VNASINSKIRSTHFFAVLALVLLYAGWSYWIDHEVVQAVGSVLLSALMVYLAYCRYTQKPSQVEVEITPIDTKLHRILSILIHVPYVFFFAIIALILMRRSWSYWIGHEVIQALGNVLIGWLMAFLTYKVIRKITRIAVGKTPAWSQETLIAFCGPILAVLFFLLHHVR
jgi:hypothetical protein